MDKVHIRIGSALDNQLVVEETGIDNYHLELFSDTEGNVFITDLNSKNGTFVNGRELSGFTLLNKGDKVVLGRYFLFRWESYILKRETIENLKQNNTPSEPVSSAKPKENKKLNKQIIVIYTLIVVVLLLMSYVLN